MLQVPERLPKARAKVIRPRDGQIIEGDVRIFGTAIAFKFSHYTLSYANQENPEEETIIGTYEKQVQIGVLGEWDTKSILDGSYILTLRVFSKDGEVANDKKNIGVDNNPPYLIFSSPLDGEVVQSPFEVKGTVRDSFLKNWKLFSISSSPRVLCHFDGNTINERTQREGETIGTPTYEEGKFGTGIYISEGCGVIYPPEKKILESGTIEMWVKQSWDEDTSHVLLSTETNPSNPVNSLIISKEGTGITFSIYDSSGAKRTCLIPLTDANVQKDIPFHVSATWMKGDMNLSVNGFPSQPPEGEGTGILSSVGKIFIGFIPQEEKQAEAVIDELSIYPYPRPLVSLRADVLSEIHKDMGSGKTLISTGKEPVEDSLLGVVETEDKPGERLTLSLEAKDALRRRTTISENVLIDTYSPYATITSPEEGASVSGEVSICGTAFDMDISSWVLSFKSGDNPNAPGEWTTIASGEDTVWQEKFMEWDTSLLSGPHIIKLEVSDSHGKTSCSYCHIDIISAIPLSAEITSPVDGSAVSMPLEVRGSVLGGTLSSWTLSYREKSPMLLCHFEGNTINERDGQPGVITGSPTFEEGKFGQGIRIGEDDTLIYPSEGNFSIEKGTVELWVKPRWSGSDREDHIFFASGLPEEQGGDVYKDWMVLGHVEKQIIFYVFDSYGLLKGCAIPVDDEVIPAGLPFHVAATWDSGDIRLYLNGEEVLPSPDLPGEGEISKVGDSIYVGSSHIPGIGADAVIDELSVYDFQRPHNALIEDFHAEAQRSFCPEWKEISSGNSPMFDGLLGTVDMNPLPGEELELRLTATGTGGDKVEDSVSVVRDSSSPRAEILSPVRNQLLFRTVPIKGIATDIDLENYQLFYMPGTEPKEEGPWTIIGEPSHKPVCKGILGTWDTSSCENGFHVLRLEVKDRSGKISNAYQVVELNNDIPEAHITFPKEKGGVPEMCNITGTASGPNFSSYRLEQKLGHDKESKDEWALIGEEHRVPVEDGVLEVWDTTSLPEAPFLLRLTVFGLPGMEITDIVPVYIDHTTPVAMITSPEAESMVSGFVRIEGTAKDTHFMEYYLEYSQAQEPLNWIRIDSSINPVEEGTLGWWNIEKVPDGEYFLKLITKDTAQHESSCILSLHISNPGGYEIESIFTYPEGACLAVGESQGFICIGKGNDGFNHLLDAEWSTSGDVGTIGENGVFTATSHGHGFVIASHDVFSFEAPVSGVTKITDTVAEEDETWTPEESPYVLGSWYVVPPGKTLNILPGTIIKVEKGGFFIEGTLKAEGSSRITSFKDDTAGDTNADRDKTSPSPGDWSTIYFAPSSRGSTLDGLEVVYSGKETDEDIIGGKHVLSSSAILSDGLISQISSFKIMHSGGSGLVSRRFIPSLSGCYFENISGYFARMTGSPLSGKCLLEGNYFSGGSRGVCIYGEGELSINSNTFSDVRESFGIEAFNFEKISLSNTNISNCYGGAFLETDSATDVVEVTSNVFDCSIGGVQTRTKGEVTISKNNIKAAHDFYCPYGISTWWAAKATITENEVALSGLRCGSAVEANSCSNVEINDNALSGGIAAISLNRVDSFHVLKNGISGSNPNFGVKCYSSSGTISEQEITGCGTGVQIMNNSDVTVGKGCSFSGCSFIGTEAWYSTLRFKSTTVSFTDGMCGVMVNGGSFIAEKTTFIFNEISFDPILCQEKASCIVKPENTLYDTIKFVGVSEPIIGGNTFYGGGIEIESTSEPLISDNTFYDAGINLNNTSKPKVENNIFSGGSVNLNQAEEFTLNKNKLNGIGAGGEGSGAIGVHLSLSTGIARGNVITGYDCGLSVERPKGYPDFEHNTIKDNSIGAYCEKPGHLNAKNCWWGDGSGPAPFGTCNGIDTCKTVDVIPWVGMREYYARVNGPNSDVYICGEPVNMSTGNFTHSHTDFSLQTTGPRINIRRTYNSFPHREERHPDGPFGYGWEYTYSARLEPYLLDFCPNDMMLVKEDGSTQRYIYNGDNTWHPEDEDYTVLTRNPDSTWTISHKDGSWEKFGEFSDRTLITEISDRNENTLSITRDSEGEVTSVTDACGQTADFSYDSSGHIKEVTDPAGRSFTYKYDDEGNLTEVHDFRGGVTKYAYDSEHRLLKITDPNGATFLTNKYDEQDRVVSQDTMYPLPAFEFSYDYASHESKFANALYKTTAFRSNVWLYRTGETDALGGKNNITYDSHGNVSSRTDKNGNTTYYTYDENGNPLTETDPLGNKTSRTYDEKGNCLSTTDPLGNITTWTYDSKGNMTSETDPLGNTTTYTYDSMGRLLTVTDPPGRTTTNEYDERENLIKVINPDGGVTTYTYDEANRKTSETDPLGNKTTYTYDAMGHVLTKTDPEGNTTTYEYDADGNQISETDPLGNRNETVYNDIGLMIREIDPMGGTTTYWYDFNIQLTEVKDPLGNRKELYERDDIGRVELEERNGRYVRRTYDREGNILTETDAYENKTTFSYDAVGRMISETDPLGNTTTHLYDACGREISTTDPMGHETTNTYDALGRIIQTTDPEGNETTSTYDALGNLISETDPEGNTITYSYDSMNRLISSTDPEGRVISYTYDLNGNKTSITDGEGSTTTLSYDKRGLLLNVEDPQGNQVSFTYDSAGRRTSVKNPKAGVTNFSYDPCGRKITETTPEGEETSYTYDLAGRMTEKQDGEETSSYTYDWKGNLTDSSYPEGLEEHICYDNNNRPVMYYMMGCLIELSYDENGRMKSASNGFMTTTATYDEVGNIKNKKLTTIKDEQKEFSYTYSPSGRMTNLKAPDGTTTFTYSP
ncbi:MAG: right-handed parallel beta-helix repeat-containing protein [Actinomycetota bacterium]|nr:right-handed parallel beta-helix repeat-containing protein [Actinomycetota bacterium]